MSDHPLPPTNIDDQAQTTDGPASDPAVVTVTKSSEKSKALLFGTGALVVLVLVFGVAWVTSGGKITLPQPSSSSAVNLPSINQIRQIFLQVGTSTTGSVEGISTSSPAYIPATLPGNTYIMPRGPLTPNSPLPQKPPAYVLPPSQPSQTLYQNSLLGFQITLPADWQAQTSGPNLVNFFDISTGQEVGYIEVYNNTSNQTLTDIYAELKNSPDVTGISNTFLNNQPALQFSATTQQNNGIAAVYNNRIYYLRGELVDETLRSGFKFN